MRVLVPADGALGYRPEAHAREHSIEVQLPLLQVVRPGARIVPLAVSAGTDGPAIEAGRRIGEMLKELDLTEGRGTGTSEGAMADYFIKTYPCKA